jgi:thiosulfate/3-mercaptopyruvate sulfurtransferase
VPARPLVTAAWLAARIDDPHLVVADVRWYLQGKRGIDAYNAGHLPRAQFVDVDRDLSSAPATGRPGRHPLPSAQDFADILERIGARPDGVVVAYDDTGGATAARLWWLLRYFGHDIGRVLDGGIHAWVNHGGALETTTKESPRAPRMKLVTRPEMVLDKAQVKDLVLRKKGLLLDARATERFEGKVEPIDARPGHIPGARSAPFLENLTAPGGTFRPPDELEKRYASLGVDAAEPVVVYCGSGVTACHDLLALSLTGRNSALLYEGSWSEWAGDPALPVAVGPSKAE